MTRAARYEKHVGLANAIAREFYLPGGDMDDVRQEARLALWIATGRYEDGRGLTFGQYARTMIRRRLIDLLNAALRHKHAVLTNAVRVTVLEDGGELEEVAIVDTLPADDDVPRLVVLRDTLDRLAAAVDELTPRQRECFVRSLNEEWAAMSNADHQAANVARRTLRAAA